MNSELREEFKKRVEEGSQELSEIAEQLMCDPSEDTCDSCV